MFKNQIDKEFEQNEIIQLDQLIKFNPKQFPKYLKYIADLFLGKEDYDQAVKAYRTLEDHQALALIQKCKFGYENSYYKKAEVLIYLRKPDEAIQYLLSN